MVMENLHEKLWAKSVDMRFSKTGETLFQHSVNVARTVQTICERLPLPIAERQALAKVLIEAGAYHDLGKAATGFQEMLRGNGKWGHRHETLSTAIAHIINPNLDPCALFAILTHHRSIPEGEASGQNERCLPIHELPPTFGATGDDSIWQKMLTELRANWSELSDLLAALKIELGFVLENITPDNSFFELGVENKWLKRKERMQEQIPSEQKWRASLLRGLLITSDHIASATDQLTGKHPIPLDIPRLVDYEETIKAKELKSNPLLPFQQRASKARGNTILKAPTGSGKTLAALLWAKNNQAENGRFFYLLPYTASINAMSNRFREIFGEQYVGVLHHRNADYLFRTMEKDEASVGLLDEQVRFLKSLTKEMYHPIRVCTPHQILRFTLRGRGWETCLSEFPNACFVFDEVHAFEPLLAGLTLATVKLLQSPPFNAKFLFTSATIPKFLERIIRDQVGISDSLVIEPDPTNEADKKVCEKIRHRIEIREGSLLENLYVIANEIEESGQSALIVCNHVATSQTVWEFFNKRFNDVTLLHSRFNGRDRSHIEQKITARKSKEEIAELKKRIASGQGKPPILVATQAVEVSLDIDYERGYSEPAPADALGQRLGRINRSGSRPPAEVVIFDTPSAGFLYDETLTNTTVEELRKIDLLTERQLTHIVDVVYGNGYPDKAQQEFEKGLNNPNILHFAEKIVAGTYCAWTDVLFDETDGQVEVIPSSLLEEFSELRKKRKHIQANRLLVSIRVGQMYKAKKMGALFFDSKLREFITTLKYDEKKGLQLDATDDNIL